MDGEDPADRPRLLPNRPTTVHYLVTRPAPASLPDSRWPFERHIFTVVATVVLKREEQGAMSRRSKTQTASPRGELRGRWRVATSMAGVSLLHEIESSAGRLARGLVAGER
jgi:hypothetical protein